MAILKILSQFHSFCLKCYKYSLRLLYKPRWEKAGKNIRYNLLNSTFHFRNISIGNNVYIGPKAMFLSSDAKLIIGNNVLFGPNVTIITGDHATDKVGKLIRENLDKSSGNYDKDVIVEDDVWVGSNVTILKGAKISRGSILAAGSVVINDVPPYTIYGGVPAKNISKRFSFEDALAHEKVLYGNAALKATDLIHLKSTSR